ncbi:hypothetical protein VTK26DRAFT_250 [Humicola hyalothermophila]
MQFFKSVRPATAVGAVLAAIAPKDLDTNDPNSIKGVAKTIAANAMSYYSGDADKFVDLPQPHYWWQAGAFMGSMLDYSHYTGDKSYDRIIARALLDQVGPNFDFMLPSHFGQEGNDDQAFWGFSVMTAAERNFPHPDEKVPSWLQLVENIFNSQVPRWDTAACNGGLRWQIFESNPNGLDYKNTVSNGGLFQLSARLARATGNTTYLDWANKVWDWTEAVGLIDGDGNVYDGASSSQNCTDTNPLTFSYTAAIYLYGAAVMADHTGDRVWTERAQRILHAARSFFSPFDNATNIMYEHACEQVNTCNADMRSFKAYFSRFAYASALFVPELKPVVEELWPVNAQAAAQTCTGGENGTRCGQKWYVGGFDGTTGLGEEMCALETVQGLLAGEAPLPLKGDEIKTVRTFAAASPATGEEEGSSGSVKRGRYDVRGSSRF